MRHHLASCTNSFFHGPAKDGVPGHAARMFHLLQCCLLEGTGEIGLGVPNWPLPRGRQSTEGLWGARGGVLRKVCLFIYFFPPSLIKLLFWQYICVAPLTSKGSHCCSY